MASDPNFHSSKLSFLSALNPPCSNLVMLFKSSLPATKPLQSLCLSLPLNSLTCDLTGSVCPPPSPLHQSLLTPHPPMTQTPPPSTPAGSPKQLPPYSSTVVTIDPEPSAPQEPTLPALPSATATPSPFSSPPASHTHSHTSFQAHPAHLYPLWEVAGADSTIRVHVPFPMTDLSQTEETWLLL
jgi:hypothetical protein